MKNNRIGILIVKYFVLTLSFILIFIVQSTPGILQIMGVKPILLIPAMVSVAMYEGEFVGGVFGLLAGMLCDLGAFSFYGLYSMLLLLAGVFTGLMVIYWMHRSHRTALLLVFCTAALCGLIRFYFDYGLWQYEGITRLFLEQTLPGLVYTVIATPVFFWFYGRIERFFDEKTNIQ